MKKQTFKVIDVLIRLGPLVHSFFNSFFTLFFFRLGLSSCTKSAETFLLSSAALANLTFMEPTVVLMMRKHQTVKVLVGKSLESKEKKKTSSYFRAISVTLPFVLFYRILRPSARPLHLHPGPGGRSPGQHGRQRHLPHGRRGERRAPAAPEVSGGQGAGLGPQGQARGLCPDGRHGEGPAKVGHRSVQVRRDFQAVIEC